ncbi:ferritin-like domain-containing protein [Rheinheimera soli]|uniref:ferritin-like domain-containing protein n=1 Tax=Rheinheimera soli TaxID=443616 RepID=UPI001E43D6B7|nr:ferritin-like domain-containing protein [Rheinheimera soli]
MRPLITDHKLLRQHARQHVETGAVTQGYQAGRNELVRLLNAALASELICVLRYRSHYFLAKGIHANTVAAEFLDHSNEELQHVDWLAARIVQLGGEPDFSPQGVIERGQSIFGSGQNLYEMIKENLVEERVAIDHYKEVLLFIGDDDPTSAALIQKILQTEEEHADELASLLWGLPEQHN